MTEISELMGQGFADKSPVQDKRPELAKVPASTIVQYLNENGGNLHEFQGTLSPKVNRFFDIYFRSPNAKPNDGSTPPEVGIDRWNDDGTLSESSPSNLYDRGGIPYLAFLNSLDGDEIKRRSEGHEWTYMSESMLFQAYEAASALPPDFDPAKRVPKLPGETEDHRGFRQLVGIIKNPPHVDTEDHSRYNEIRVRVTASPDRSVRAAPDEIQFLRKHMQQLVKHNHAVRLWDALRDATYQEGPPLAELMKEADAKAGEWLLDQLEQQKQKPEDTAPTSLDPHDVIPHPTDVLALGDAPRRKFKAERPERMEGYQYIIRHFEAQGYSADYSAGEVVPGEEQGIKLSEEREKAEPHSPRNTDGQAVDARTIDIARLRKPNVTKSDFEIENFSDGACYVVHPGIKKFWQEVYGDTISFADITDKMSRRTMRILGARPIDHITVQGRSWNDRVIDLIEQEDGVEMVDIMLATLFDSHKRPPLTEAVISELGEEKMARVRDTHPLLSFKDGRLVANVVHKRSEKGQKEWDEQVPEPIMTALNGWLDRKPEMKQLLEERDYMKVARQIVGSDMDSS